MIMVRRNYRVVVRLSVFSRLHSNVDETKNGTACTVVDAGIAEQWTIESGTCSE